MNKKFIALLRGINVSGQKKIKMTDLKKLFEDVDFTNIQTYIQSGNVIFDSDNPDLKFIKSRIAMKIKSKYGFDVDTIITTNAKLKYVLNHNNFARKNAEAEKLYVTFLDEKPDYAAVLKLKNTDYKPEDFIIDNDVIYLYLPNGYGKSKLNNNLFETRLKTRATTRNWKTINALYELSKKD